LRIVLTYCVAPLVSLYQYMNMFRIIFEK
jgi:hypothetical protein